MFEANNLTIFTSQKTLGGLRNGRAYSPASAPGPNSSNANTPGLRSVAKDRRPGPGRKGKGTIPSAGPPDYHLSGCGGAPRGSRPSRGT